jgi:hypothetical protein
MASLIPPITRTAALLLATSAMTANAQSTLETEAISVPSPPAGTQAPTTTNGARSEEEVLAEDGLASESPIVFSLTTYVWLTSFNGSTVVDGRKSDVDTSFDTIFENADSLIGVMGAIDMEHKRLVLQFNGVYSAVDFSGETTRVGDGPLGGTSDARIEADISVKSTLLEFFGGYRFLDREFGGKEERTSRFMLDGFVGARYTNLDMDTRLSSDTTVTLRSGRTIEAGRSIDSDISQEWIEPFVGGRIALMLNERWLLGLRGDVGGFGVDGSEFTWSSIAYVGYRWRFEGWDLSLLGGYRAIGQDYSNDDFTYDVVTHGPVLGASVTLTF